MKQNKQPQQPQPRTVILKSKAFDNNELCERIDTLNKEILSWCALYEKSKDLEFFNAARNAVFERNALRSQLMNRLQR